MSAPLIAIYSDRIHADRARNIVMPSAKYVLLLLGSLLLSGTGTRSGVAEEAPIAATEWFVAHASRVRLVGGGHFDPADPNSPRLAGVEIRLDPNWKTYWRMPGEAGVPPQFDWSKSENVEKIDVLYPAPRRYPDKGGDAVGYANSVIFPVVVTPRDPSKAVKLAVELAFGICKDICVPLETTLGVDIEKPVMGAAAPRSLKAMLDRVPRQQQSLRSADPRVTAVSGAVQADPKVLTIVTDPAGGGPVDDVFVEAPDGMFVPLAKRAAPAKGASAQQAFIIDFRKLADAADYVGKPLRITVVGPDGASETVFTPLK